MKLFIWHNPYEVPWGNNLYYAVAESVEDAKAMILSSKVYLDDMECDRPDRESPPIDIVLNDPNHILEVPCGRIQVWAL